MKYIFFTFLILLLCQSAFSQSKKEQIETLIFQKDSLVRVLENERQMNTDQVKQLETKISKINSDMALIQKELAQTKKELTQSKIELAKKEEEIGGLMVGQVLREDTIRSLREELHQIKASNSNSESNSLSTSTIGKSIRIGNLEVAQFDFPDSMTWDDAVNACAALGKGWRLPTKNELNVLYQNKGKIGGFASASNSSSSYWSSTEHGFSSDDGEIAWCQVFYSGSQNYVPKFFPQSVRAVRTF